jgi:predicted esterase
MKTRSLRLVALLSLVAAAGLPAAQDDVADVPSRDLVAGKDKQKRYFLIGPAKEAKAPRAGYGLIVVLPGGPGTPNFHPFVKRIYKNAVPEGYLVAQLVAVKWKADQEIVWPTATLKAEGMEFGTEQLIDAVIDDVATRHRIDTRRVFTLSWSSGGPAAYAASLTSKKVTGSFIAMSVFNPKYLPDLKKARGHAYCVYHSRADRVCPYRMAEQAGRDLKKSGAKVKLVEYQGGHGWRGPLYDDIREGIRWLQENHAAPAGK